MQLILQQKRHLSLFAAAWILGTVLCCRKEDVWIPVAVLLGAALAYGTATGKKRRERIVTAGIVLCLILTAFFLCGHRDQCDRRIQEMLKTAPGTELSGTVIQKEIRSDRCLYYLNTPYKKVIVYFESDEIPVGSAVTVTGNWEVFSPATNEGSFDYAEDYRCQNISFRIFADAVRTEREPVIRFREGLYRLKKRISAVFAASLNEREAGVLSALTVGARGLLDPGVRAMYQNAGISHILAISGMHISILGFGIYRFLRKVRVPCHLCEGLGCAVVLCFVLMSGTGSSAVRALVMYLLLMGARASGRTYDPLNALSLAALILLIPNPLNLYRSGFQFSFLAMAAIVLFSAVSEKAERDKAARRKEKESGERAPCIQDRKARERNGSAAAGDEPGIAMRLTVGLKGRLLFGAFLQLALLPLTAWCYCEVPLYATFLNLLVLPLCSALLGFGLAGGIFGIFFPQAAKWLLVPCHGILRIYEAGIALVNRLPLHQWITGRPSAWLLLVFYLSLAGACIVFMKNTRKGMPLLRKGRLGNLSERAKKYIKLSALTPIVLLMCILFMPERQFCRIDMLDVGQGDGIFLTDGAGTYIMIDGGSTSESAVGTYEIEPFLKYHGIRRIDAWIVTHGDLDHYSGLLEMLKDGYRVDYLVLAEAMPHDEAWETLTAAADSNGTKVVYVTAGDEIKVEGCEMACLYPAAEDVTEESAEDANEFSQVWLFRKENMSVLFTGDLGEEQERILLERGVLSDCLLLKVAHHGSKYSSCEEFLEAVSPEYAVISCGEHSIYGHPAPETLERLANAGCEIYQTPQCGQITFYEKRGRWRLHMNLS